MNATTVPSPGFGIGLRPAHYQDFLSAPQRVDWLEIISENYLVPGGKPLRMLDAVRERYPVVMHGVSMSIGSARGLDASYLRDLARLAARVQPLWLSDHLCWTGVAGRNLHDLLPLPYNEESIAHVTERIQRVQDRLGRRIAIENVSSYISFANDDVPEWEFLVAVANAADCGILLDVNNVFVSAHNHGFDPEIYLDAIPAERVFQIHLAGHSESGALLIDTHDHPVRDEVFSLFERTYRRIGPVSTLIEWDDRIPDFDRLEAEAARARAITTQIRDTERQDGRTGRPVGIGENAAAAARVDQRA